MKCSAIRLASSSQAMPSLVISFIAASPQSRTSHFSLLISLLALPHSCCEAERIPSVLFQRASTSAPQRSCAWPCAPGRCAAFSFITMSSLNLFLPPILVGMEDRLVTALKTAMLYSNTITHYSHYKTCALRGQIVKEWSCKQLLAAIKANKISVQWVGTANIRTAGAY